MIIIQNNSGRRITIQFSNDPDIRITEHFAEDTIPLVAIEIKGGEDISNIHNRVGEAEKSHMPAVSDAPTNGIREAIAEHEAEVSQEQPESEEREIETDAGDEEEPPHGSLLLTEEIWDRALKRMDAPLASKLFKAEHDLTGDRLVLTLNGGDAVFADSIKKQHRTIAEIFSEEIGSRIRVEVVTVKKKTVRKKDLKNEIMSDPEIKAVLELFDGRVVDVIPGTNEKET
jgi:hypothetical protein